MIYINKKKTYYENCLKVLAGSRDSKTFWTFFNKFRSNTVKRPNLIKLESWQTFLYDSFPNIPIPQQLANNNYDITLDSPISTEELSLVLKNCKQKKALGSDYIVNAFYKNLPDNWLMYLQVFFNKILDSKQIPQDWCVMLISPLFKNKDPLLPSNYRFISLINCITKIFTSILDNRLTKFVTQNNLIPEFQAGF